MQPKNNIMYSDTSKSLKMISKNIVHLMSSLPIDVQTLSEKTGVGTATINNLRRGEGNPTIGTLSSIAEFFNVSVGKFTDEDLSKNQDSSKGIMNLPLIRYSDIEDFLYNGEKYTKTFTTAVDNCIDESMFAIEITNNSLSPELEKGAICIVSRNEEYCDGDIVLLKNKDYPVCFRRIFVSNNGFLFSPISLESNEKLIEYNEYVVLGVLLKKINRMK